MMGSFFSRLKQDGEEGALHEGRQRQGSKHRKLERLCDPRPHCLCVLQEADCDKCHLGTPRPRGLGDTTPTTLSDASHPVTKEQDPLLEGYLQTPAGPCLEREGSFGTSGGGSLAWQDTPEPRCHDVGAIENGENVQVEESRGEVAPIVLDYNSSEEAGARPVQSGELYVWSSPSSFVVNVGAWLCDEGDVQATGNHVVTSYQSSLGVAHISSSSGSALSSVNIQLLGGLASACTKVTLALEHVSLPEEY